MKPLWIVCDVEADGNAPGLYSMYELGAVVVNEHPRETFYAKFRPLPDATFSEEALAVRPVTRAETLTYPDPLEGMTRFYDWLSQWKGRRLVFVSDNPAYDFQFVNWYFIRFLGENPFGWSGRQIGDIWAGLVKDTQKPWKHLRETRHTHHPVDDAMGNVEALLKMAKEHGLRAPWL
jgi:hypothetical protein